MELLKKLRYWIFAVLGLFIVSAVLILGGGNRSRDSETPPPPMISSAGMEVSSVGGIGAEGDAPVPVLVERKDLESYNTYVYEQPSSMRTEIHGAWVNYKDAQGKWQEINPNIQDCGTTYCVLAAPFESSFPKSAGGIATFHNNNRWDVVNLRSFSEPTLDKTIQALGVNDVSGTVVSVNIPNVGTVSAVKYTNAYPILNADLYYFVWQATAPRLAKIVQFNSAPSSDVSLRFSETYSANTEIYDTEQSAKTKWDKVSTTSPKEGTALEVRLGTSTLRGISMKPPKVWDSASSSQYIKYALAPIDATHFILTKYIPLSFFTKSTVLPVYTDTLSTFFPDPDVEVRTVDGGVCDGGGGACIDSESWVLARGGAGAGADDTTANDTIPRAFGGSGDLDIGITRGIFLFDASGTIPVGSTINSSTLSFSTIEQQAQDSDSESFIVVVSSTPASNTGLVSGDYTKVGNSSSSELSARFMLATSASTTGPIFALNATGTTFISTALSSVDGIIKLGIREGHDLLNIPIAGVNLTNYCVCATADTAGTSTDPILQIDWTAAVAGTTTNLIQIRGGSLILKGGSLIIK